MKKCKDLDLSENDKIYLDGPFWIGTMVGDFIEKTYHKIKNLISKK